MATLNEIYARYGDSSLRNSISAAGWIKAKSILLDVASTAEELAYAARLLGSKDTPTSVHLGTLTVLQANADPDDAAIQTAVDSVVAKLAAQGV